MGIQTEYVMCETPWVYDPAENIRKRLLRQQIRSPSQIMFADLDRRIYTARLPQSTVVFGCGRSALPALLTAFLPESDIVAYDSDKSKIDRMLEIKQRHIKSESVFDYERVHYTQTKPHEKFDLVFAVAVLHHNPTEISGELAELVANKGYVAIIDYDMKHCAKENFFSRWGFCDSEIRETQEIGQYNTYKVHTCFGLDDCIKLMENAGLKTISAQGKIPARRSCADEPTTEHFVYIGKKQ